MNGATCGRPFGPPSLRSYVRPFVHPFTLHTMKASVTTLPLAELDVDLLLVPVGSDALEASFSDPLEGAPVYPHYTRPASYRGWQVPEVLLSDDHARVREWRREQSRRLAGSA